MQQSSYGNQKSGFPDPLLPRGEKETKEYGLKFARAIMDQWSENQQDQSLLKRRNKVFERNRKYANGIQDTTIYRELLTSLDPNNGDGSFLNIDFTPVPILPKFARIVANKILSRKPYPNLEATDPLSSSEKDAARRKVEMQIMKKEDTSSLMDKLGMSKKNVNAVPDTLEEVELLQNNNIKSSGEIVGQLAANMTLEWADFNDSVFRRSVNDLVALGMAVVKRRNDPNYGIIPQYVDPKDFIHSYTDDPSFSDMIYAGHIERISIQELRRRSAGQLSEEDLKGIAKKAANKYGYDSTRVDHSSYDRNLRRNIYGYDEFMVEVLSFEFKSVDKMCFEEKESKYGNVGFYFKGNDYKAPKNSIFNRSVTELEIETVYGGSYIIGCDKIFDYCLQSNMPKTIHDVTRVDLSYSVAATNIHNMLPKSMIDSCIGFADQLQITHLKIQQSIAKAKPDGLVIDIEALENVQLGKGGELQPIDLHDIYEQTGVYYYRGKNPDGGYQNPPIREIGNSVRNINEFIAIYNHYLRMIRDATGINEAMDASSPKGDDLVGVRQQAINAGNNAIYDITNASMVLYKKVVKDIVKCLQVMHPESKIYQVYENAIGKENAKLLSSFSNLPLFNFGVVVQKEMEDYERTILEQNIQVSLAQRELDLEDAIAIRELRDVNQAQRLLVVRRKKRMKANQEMAQQNSMMQAQVQQQSAQSAAQAEMQKKQMEAQINMQMKQVEHQLELQKLQFEYQQRKEIELIRAQASLGFKTEDQEFKEKLEVLKEDRKDERVEQQAAKQSKLISQRQGLRGELDEPQKEGEAPNTPEAIIEQMINQE